MVQLRVTQEDGGLIYLEGGTDAVLSENIPDATGTSAVTLGTLTSAASGGLGAKGTSAATLVASTSTATGRVIATGTSAVTLAAITSTATGRVIATGTSAATLAASTSATTASVTIAGPSAVTLAALTSTGTGKRGNAGTSAATLATSTSTAAGMIPAAGSAATTLADLTTVGTDAPDRVTITFDDGTIPTDFYWSAFGPGSVIDRPDAGGGTTKALRYPDIDDSEETYFEIYAAARPGNNLLTVRYEVSSESGYDYWRIYIDGVQQWQEAGTGAGWSEVSLELDVGARLIKFRYSKDSSADDGDDTAYISKIIVSPIGDRPVTASSTLDNLTSSASGETEIFPGYRFWRVYTEATGSISGTSGGIGELELRASLLGPDLTDTLPGIASQPLGTVSYPAANAFDNDQSTSWFAGTEYSALQWEFTTYPQEVAQVNIKAGTIFNSELLDLSIQRSYGGQDGTWETIATKRGIVETASLIGGELNINLIDPTVPRDGYLGINDFGATISSYTFCEPDFVSVVGHYTPVPITIERLITYSSAVHPLVIGATTYPFKIRGVIYASDGVGGNPGTLLVTTAERTSCPNDWFELFLSAPVPLPPGTYYLGVQIGGTSGGLYCRQTVGPNTRLTVAATYASGAPASFPSGATALAQNGAIYAIYPISTGASTLAALTSTATGFFSDAEPIEAEAEQLLDDMVGSAAGTFFIPVTGTASSGLEVLTSAALGARGVFRPRVALHGTVRRRA